MGTIICPWNVKPINWVTEFQKLDIDDPRYRYEEISRSTCSQDVKKRSLERINEINWPCGGKGYFGVKKILPFLFSSN
jgi:hypothetical protein